MGLPRPSRQIGDRSPNLPLGGGLLIDPEALGQRPQALLTMLYRSTDRLSRRGAPVQNLAHSASFESLDKDAPSKAGTKNLGMACRGAVTRPDQSSVRCPGSALVSSLQPVRVWRNPGVQTG